MPSPFPGMDPYIEGQGWLGFRTQYIAQLQRILAPLVRPRYVVFIEEHVYTARPAAAKGPSPRRHGVTETGEKAATDCVNSAEHGARDAARRAGAGSVAVLEAPVTLRLPQLEVERQVYVEVRRRDTGRIVCVIELLAPINKARGFGQQEYLTKRVAFIQSPAHLVELDLLRGGVRLPMEEPLPPADYYVFISHADRRPDCGLWPIRLQDRLPTIRVPLSGDVEAVPLDLQVALDAVYDGAVYADMLDYRHGTEPPLAAEEAAWAEALLTSGTGRS